MLKEWQKEYSRYPALVHAVTRSKKNYTAYEPPGEYKDRERRPIHGASVHIQELFTLNASSFKEAKLPMYGMEKQVRYLSCTYLWGQKLYQPLQFVLVNDENKPTILVSTDLTMSAEEVIIVYSYRFKFEAMFREFKLHFGGLFYHFGTKAVPKLNHYRKKGVPTRFSR